MKKNVIALAVAAAMAAPLAAQAEVSISGGLQAQLVNIGGDAGTSDGLYATDGGEYSSLPGGAPLGIMGGGENGGSYGYLKFSASEDLGGGLKALAMYNFAINVGDGNLTPASAGQGQRDAYVGLSGSFGTVLAGTMSTPYKSSTVKWDPFVATFMQSRSNGGMSALHNSYAGNALAYANKFGMAKVVAAIVLDENADTSTATTDSTVGNHAMSLAVNVPVGPVELALAYMDSTDFGVANPGTNAPDSTAMKLGVKYNAGPITVAAQYEDLDTGYSVSSDSDTFMYLTGSYTAGANTFSASYGMQTIGSTGTTADVDVTYMAIGMKHAFSKSTSAYAGYRATDPDLGAVVTGASVDENALGVGLRVAF